MVKIMNHDIFGELHYNNNWHKEIELNLFGNTQKMELIIEGEENGEFEEEQIEAYKKFMQNKEELLEMCEEKVYIYYQEVNFDYRERLGEQFKDKLAPVINTQDEINKLVYPKQILFPMVFGDMIREFGLLCECTWEEEHGLAVKYQNEEVVEVGYQDIII